MIRMLKKINKNTAIRLLIFLLMLTIMASSIMIVPRHNLYAQTLEEELEQIKKKERKQIKRLKKLKSRNRLT